MKTKTTSTGSVQEIDPGINAPHELFGFMVESMIDGAVILDKDGRITYANQSICRLSGFSKDELTGSKYLVFIDHAERSLLKNIFSDSGCKKIDQLKTILRSKTGKEIHVVLSWNPYLNNDGEIEGHCLFFKDITQERKLDGAYKESKENYRLFIENHGEGIGIVDKDENFILTNPVAEQIFGVAPGGLANRNLKDFIVPEQFQKILEETKKRSQLAKSTYEVDIITPAGEVRNLLVTATPQIDREGNHTGNFGVFRDITELKNIQEKLRQGELRYRTLFESAQDSIFLVHENRFVDCNPAALRIFGCEKHEIVGQTPEIFSPVKQPDGRDSFEKSREKLKLALEGDSHLFEWRHKQLKGIEFDVEVMLTPIEVDSKSMILAFVRDITEKKNAEKLQLAKKAAETLLKSEEKFSKAFHNSPVPICITTLYNPQIIEVNESFEEQTGFTKEELKDHSLLKLPIFHDLQDLKMIIHSLTNKGYVRNQEITFRIKNGDKRICLLSSEVFELGGEPCVLTVLLDITERQLAEKIIAESQQRFELMIEQTFVGFVECDTNFIITSWNPSAERIFGYTAKEAIGRHVGNLIVKEEDWAERNKLWRDILQSEGGISTTNANQTKDGRTITCEWHDTAITDHKGHVIGIVSLVDDISERMEIEESLRNSREQLKHFAQHLQTVREEERVHISRELHDSLGQSLTGLKMYAFNISNKLNSELSGKNLDNVRDQAKEVLGIIDGIMQQVRKIAKDLRPPILDEVGLIPAIESHIREITKQTNIKYEFIKMIHTIEMDPGHSIEVFRIFQEACTNIIRHANATKIIVRVNAKINSYILEVEDNGCGIKETDISKLKSLGLLGMKERSQVFGGNLEITGVEGKGTKVVLTFPKKNK
jgi:PAS domain S-box-containing protein